MISFMYKFSGRSHPAVIYLYYTTARPGFPLFFIWHTNSYPTPEHKDGDADTAGSSAAAHG